VRSGAMREYDRLQVAQWLPPAEFEAESRKGLADLLRWACVQVPYYSEFCQEAGLDPTRLEADDLPAFPLMTKRELMDRQERFLASGRVTPDSLATSTGGSSGVVFKFFVDRRARDLRAGNAILGETWAGWRPGDKQAVLWGHPRESERIRSLKNTAMAALVHRSLNLNTFDLDETVVAEFAERLHRWRPAMIRGYASALAYLSGYLTRGGIDIAPPKGIISTAETLTDEYRADIERCFRCKVINRYGSREFANVAQQCEEVAGLHVFNDRVHLEILRPDGEPCAPGERGEIVITSLDNRVMAFIRYRTGDLARGQEGTCACGRGFPLLAAVEGRTSELIVGKNGKYYSCPGPRFYGADIPGIGQMQIIQETLEEIEMRIVPNPDWSEDSRVRLTARMRDLLGDIHVTINLVEKIPPSPSGKYPFTISKVSPFRN
jgi:phenylacetate-CoA ligase